jgi:hypothetical protein
VRRGIFFDPAALSVREQGVLVSFSRKHGHALMTVDDFIETIFFKLAYEFRATIVGFNLPFDISRLAIRHGSARRHPMRGGFSFQLSTKPWWPRIQVKHLDRKASMIRLTAPAKQLTPRGMRKRSRVAVRRGFFVDVKTFGAALTSRSDTLASLAEFLKVPSRKVTTEEHGGPLTMDYIAYGVNDTQVTWECYAELLERYRKHDLRKTPAYRIYSEAGIGKAYLKEMDHTAVPADATEFSTRAAQHHYADLFRWKGRSPSKTGHQPNFLLRLPVDVSDRLHADGLMAVGHRGWDGLEGQHRRNASDVGKSHSGRSPEPSDVAKSRNSRPGDSGRRYSATSRSVQR